MPCQLTDIKIVDVDVFKGFLICARRPYESFPIKGRTVTSMSFVTLKEPHRYKPS